MPKLSIICPCYNHEKYIDDFLLSFVNQTEKDIELIIVDDFSTDNTLNIIKTYDDSRIILIQNTYNMGINATIKKGILACSSSIFAICASDDILFPEYAKTVINFFNTNLDIHIFFTSIQDIDANGKVINNIRTIQNNLTKYQILEKLFLFNFIPAPGSAFRKASVLKSTSIPAGLFQLQDYHFHIEMLLHYDFYTHQSPLIYYRITNNSVSINSSYLTVLRSEIEHEYILDLYYSIESVELLKLIFKNNPVFDKFGEPIQKTIPFFVCIIAIESYDNKNALWGYKSLIKYYSDKDNQQLLFDLYKFQFKDYINESKFIPDIHNHKKIHYIRKKRKLVSILAVISIIINLILLLYINI